MRLRNAFYYLTSALIVVYILYKIVKGFSDLARGIGFQ
jgi:hypothetical protein